MIVIDPSRITKNKDYIKISSYNINTGSKSNKEILRTELDNLILFKNSSISTDAITFLNKPIYILDGNNLSHIVVSINNNNKMFEYDKLISKLNYKRKNKLAYVFCKGVCLGRIKNLIRLNENRGNLVIKQKIKDMHIELKKLKQSMKKNSMMAIEGNIAKMFFSCLSILYTPFLLFASLDFSAFPFDSSNAFSSKYVVYGCIEYSLHQHL